MPSHVISICIALLDLKHPQQHQQHSEMVNENNEEETKPPASCKFFHQVINNCLEIGNEVWNCLSRPRSRSWEVPRVQQRSGLPRDNTPLFPRCPRTPSCKSMWNVQSATSSSSRPTSWRSIWSCTMGKRQNSVPSARNLSTRATTLKLTWELTLMWNRSAAPSRFLQIITRCSSIKS